MSLLYLSSDGSPTELQNLEELLTGEGVSLRHTLRPRHIRHTHDTYSYTEQPHCYSQSAAPLRRRVWQSCSQAGKVPVASLTPRPCLVRG